MYICSSVFIQKPLLHMNPHCWTYHRKWTKGYVPPARIWRCNAHRIGGITCTVVNHGKPNAINHPQVITIGCCKPSSNGLWMFMALGFPH